MIRYEVIKIEDCPDCTDGKYWRGDRFIVCTLCSATGKIETRADLLEVLKMIEYEVKIFDNTFTKSLVPDTAIISEK